MLIRNFTCLLVFGSTWILLPPANAGVLFQTGARAFEPEALVVIDEDSAESQTTPVSSSASVGLDSSSSLARAVAGLNRVGAESNASGDGAALQSTASAAFEDVLRFYDPFGNELTSGTAQAVLSVHGQINGNAQAGFAWDFGDQGVAGGWDNSGSSGGSIPVALNYTATAELQGSEGIQLHIEVYTGAKTDSTGTTGNANFLSTASIQSIVYRDPNGVIDPLVRVVGDSGYVYPSVAFAIPEPGSAALLILGVVPVLRRMSSRRRKVG